MADRYTFICDDYAAAKEFVLSINRKIFRQRFSVFEHWKPDHLTLVLRNNEPVALADCKLSSDGHAANASLVAKQGFGAYALIGLSQLKKRVGDLFWVSTLRAPSPATVAISRRYFHETYDEGAWEISNELTSLHGPLQVSCPIPILMSERLQKEFSLSAVSNVAYADRKQLADAMLAPALHQFRNMAGDIVPPIFAMAYGFEVFDVPMRVRQHVTRCTLLAVGMSLGHQISREGFGKLADLKLAATLTDYVKT